MSCTGLEEHGDLIWEGFTEKVASVLEKSIISRVHSTDKARRSVISETTKS